MNGMPRKSYKRTKRQKMLRSPQFYFRQLLRSFNDISLSLDKMMQEPWRSFVFTLPDGTDVVIKQPFTAEEIETQAQNRAIICDHFKELVIKEMWDPGSTIVPESFMAFSSKIAAMFEMRVSDKIYLSESIAIDMNAPRTRELDKEAFWYNYEMGLPAKLIEES